MIGRVLDLRQVQECADDIEVEERFMIASLLAQSRCLSKMKAHGVDRRLNMLVTVHTFQMTPGLEVGWSEMDCQSDFVFPISELQAFSACAT